MRAMSKRFEIGAWVFIGVLAAFAALLAIGMFTNACDIPSSSELTKDIPVHWCWEFWLYRYQTMIGAVIALTVGSLGFLAISRQTEAARASDYHQTIVALRDVQEGVRALQRPFRIFLKEIDWKLSGTIATVPQILPILSDWQAGLQSATDATRSLGRQHARLRCSNKFARKIAEFSEITAACIDKGHELSERLHFKSHSPQLFGQVINESRSCRHEFFDQIEAGCDWFNKAIENQIASVERQLYKVAPVPDPDEDALD